MLHQTEDNAELVKQSLDVNEDIAPEIATKNIENSEQYDVEPDAYKEVATELDKPLETQNRVPAQLGNATAKFVTEDSQHLQASKDNLEHLNNADGRWDYYYNKSVTIPENNRRMSELGNIARRNGGSLDEFQEDELEDLRLETQGMLERKPKDLFDVEELALDVGGAVGDIGRTIRDNVGTILGFAGAGAAGGALVASWVPVPGARIAAAATGASTGASTGFAVASAVDAYEQTAGSMYNELTTATDDKGVPLDMSHERAANVSEAVGMLSGVAGFLGGKVLAKTPFLKNITSPKNAIKMLTKNPKRLAQLAGLGAVLKTMASEGTEEGFQEIIQIIGERFAKLGDDEDSFGNEIDNLTAAFSSLDLKDAKQVGYSALIGSATGGVIEAPKQAIAFGANKVKIENEEKLTKERTETLEFQNTLLSVEEDFRKAKENSLGDKIKHKFIDKSYEFLNVDKTLHFDADKYEEFANTPEKKAALDQLIEIQGDTNEVFNELNIDPQIDTADMQKSGIISEFPDVTDQTRPNELGETPAQIKQRSKDHADKVTNAEAKLDELLKDFTEDDIVTPEIQAEFNKLTREIQDAQPFDDEFDYIDSNTFQEIEGVFTKDEAEQLNSDMLSVKLEVSKELKAEAEAEFDTVDNRIIKDVKGKQLKEQIKTFENDINVVDRFQDKTNTSEGALAITNTHKKKGFSPSAIDPNTLPEDLKEIYLKDKRLSKRKTFVEGGVHLEEAAAMNGVESGAKLLEILRDTPTKTEVKKLKAQQKIDIENNVKQITKPARQTKIDKAFGKVSAIYKKQSDIMRTKQWPNLKRGIIKIATTPVTVKEMQNKASVMVGKLKLRDLKPNKFLQGERRSKNLSLKNMLEGKPEQSSANLEKAWLNNEMRRESLKAQKKVTKAKKFWKSLESKTNVTTLHKAGLLDAMNEIRELLRLDGNDKNLASQESFNKYVVQHEKNGHYVPKIPTHLTDVRKSIKDITVDEYNAITEAGMAMLGKAKYKNKVEGFAKDSLGVLSQDQLSVKIKDELENHIDYNPERAVDNDKTSKGMITTGLDKINSYLTSTNNINSIIKHLNQESIKGFFSDLISNPLNFANQEKRGRVQELRNKLRVVRDTYYESEAKFKLAQTEFVDIEAFADIEGLGDETGRIRKFDLMVLQAYRGDADYFKDLENFSKKDGTRLSLGEIEAILETHISDKEARFVQDYFIKPFADYTEESFALHERSTGARPDAVEPRQFVHRGKVVPGGYYPGKRRATTLDVKGAKDLQSQLNKGISATDANDLAFFQNNRAAEFTKQNRLQERTGSKRALDIDYRNLMTFHEEIAHDLSFREPTQSVLKIITKSENAKMIKSTVGNDKYAILLNSVKDVASKTSERDTGIFKVDSMLSRGLAKLNSSHAVAYIGYSVSSVLNQPASLITAIMSLGPSSIVPMIKNTGKTLAFVTPDILGATYGAMFKSRMKHAMDNPSAYQNMIAEAGAIVSDVLHDQDGVDDNVVSTLSDEFTVDSRRDKSQFFHKANELRKVTMGRLAFEALAQFDKAIRVITVLSIRDQFNAGKIQGFDLKKLEAMTEAERNETLKGVATEVTRSTLTASSILDKSALEKSAEGKAFVRYFTDVRSLVNTAYSQGRKTKNAIKNKDFRETVNQATWLLISTNMLKSYFSVVQGSVGSDEDDEFDIMAEMAEFVLAPVDLILNSIPGVSSLYFAATSNSNFKQVSVPALKVLSNMVEALSTIPEWLDADEDISKSERRALIHAGGTLVGGAPTKMINNIVDNMSGEDMDLSMVEVMQETMGQFKDMLNHYIAKDDVSEEAKEYLRDELAKVPQDEESVEGLVDEFAQESYAIALSDDDWTKVNAETGASGIYQFTEERWNELIESEPDLGLTEGGRTEKDPAEQTRAMEFSLRENAVVLHTFGVEVTDVTLMGAHVFGVDEYVDIASHSDNTKLSKILGDTAKKVPYNNFKTVKQVKNYITNLL